MCQNAHFLEKSCMIAAASGAPHLNSAPTTPRCYFHLQLQHFVECVSSAKYDLFLSKENKKKYNNSKCSAFVSTTLWRLFSLQTLQFCS